jgi:lysozyme-related protein Hpa2
MPRSSPCNIDSFAPERALRWRRIPIASPPLLALPRALAPSLPLTTSRRLAISPLLALSLFLAPTIARADCIDDAATRHQVNALVLRAIGWHESRLQPGAIGHNANGSTDLGAFQINSVHLPDLARRGIDAATLSDGCANADVAAWHYRRQVDAFGNTWAAVGAYHSRTPARGAWYANRIAAILIGWRVTSDRELPFDERTALAPTVASGRPSSRATTPGKSRPLASPDKPPSPLPPLPTTDVPSDHLNHVNDAARLDPLFSTLAFLPPAR